MVRAGITHVLLIPVISHMYSAAIYLGHDILSMCDGYEVSVQLWYCSGNEEEGKLGVRK